MYELIKVNAKNGSETIHGTYSNEKELEAALEGCEFFAGIHYPVEYSGYFFVVNEK